MEFILNGLADPESREIKPLIDYIDVSGQPLPDVSGGGKSEHQRTPCFLTGRGAGFKAGTTASATENRLPTLCVWVTVKR